ncbi:MAG: D-alanyl-D-alanine carboxypeptidase [Phycisphaerales bacterium]|nr:D-alanyl-D-alanine carboxypeptidase [Phycisphaerales bacterium]
MSKKSIILFFLSSFILTACSVTSKLVSIKYHIQKDSVLRFAKVGIAIAMYQPNKCAKPLMQYHANAYFTPASNLKILTLWIALHYLPDSLLGLVYHITGDSLIFSGTADPSFLHHDFNNQPAFNFLDSNKDKHLYYDNATPIDNFYAPGWSWDDYNQHYMPERSSLPIYGNVLTLIKTDTSYQIIPNNIDANLHNLDSSNVGSLTRLFHNNRFILSPIKKTTTIQQIPFITNIANKPIAVTLLSDTLHIPINYYQGDTITNWDTLYSQSRDSLCKIMMARSDNFYADQILEMCSLRYKHHFDTKALIDSILHNEFVQIPNKPRWEDGSGLSRYNLFSPNDIVWVINQLIKNWGIEEMKLLFPIKIIAFGQKKTTIYAKTGTMGGVTNLSGFFATSKNRIIIFSLLLNDFIDKIGTVNNARNKLLLSIIKRLH